MRIQHNPQQQIFLEDLWVKPHQHKHGMALQGRLCRVQQELLKTPKELPQYFSQIAVFSLNVLTESRCMVVFWPTSGTAKRIRGGKDLLGYAFPGARVSKLETEFLSGYGSPWF